MKGGELQAGRLEPCTPEAGGREKDGERGGGGRRGRDAAWGGMLMAWGQGGGRGVLVSGWK